MCSLVTGAGGPSADELAQRFADRSSRTAKEAPPSLGPPAPPPPDPSGLPPGVGRVMHATGIAMGELFGSSEAPHEENLLRGLAASGGVYEGPARRVSGPSEFDRIVQGDVLVTESTTEAFNILLPLLGAIVTDAAACSRTRRSWRVSTAFPAWSERAMRPTSSPTARACESTAMPVK